MLLSLTLNLAGNGRTGLWDRDEPRYAVCVREMRVRGDWIFPTFNGEPRYHKPILIYWLMGLGTALAGDNPFGVRLVSSLAGAATVLGDVVAGPSDVRPGRRPTGRADAGDSADRDRRIEAGDDRRDPGAMAFRLSGMSLGAGPAAVAQRGRTFLGIAQSGDADQGPGRAGLDRGFIALAWWWGWPALAWKRLHWRWGLIGYRDLDGPLVHRDQRRVGGRVSAVRGGPPDRPPARL